MGETIPLRALLVPLCLLLVVAPATGTAVGAAPTGDLLIVDGEADGDSAYATIQAAVDAAAPGDRIEVRPGTYEGTVVLDESVELVAPDGATLDGSATDGGTAIRLTAGSDAAPTVAGFTITRYRTGVDAAGTVGDWTLRNLTLAETTVAVAAADSTGEWRLSDVTVVDTTGVGLFAPRSTGDWTVVGSTFRDTALSASGVGPVRANGTAVYAPETDGSWRIRNATVVGNDRFGVYAVDADPAGAATDNWWGSADGPTNDDCVGSVDCSAWLTSAPSGAGSPDGGLDPEVAAFDTNGIPGIQPVEAQAAIVALNNGETTPRTVQGIIVALNGG